MTVKNVIYIFLFIYPLSLYFTNTNYVGIGGNNSLRVSLLTSSIFIACYLFFYLNKRVFHTKEKLHIILGFLLGIIVFKIFSLISVWYKSDGEDITNFVMQGEFLTLIANAIQIVIFVNLVNWIFRKLISTNDTNQTLKHRSSRNSSDDALFQAINEKKKDDPLVGLKIGSNELMERLIGTLKNEKGVHIESLLGIIGSIGGYSCHVAIREELIKNRKIGEQKVFTIVGAADGKKYYFGDLVNKPLVENQLSIWSLVAGSSNHFETGSLLDVSEIFSHVAGTVGGDDFGVPRIPSNHKLGDLPINYVKTIWKRIVPILDDFCDNPIEKPILIGFAAQQVIEMGKDIIVPSVAAKIVMECAIPMSKIGPEWIE